MTPATSAVLQHKLGAPNTGTFDIACACASFPTGLATAAGWIAANPSIRTVLVVGVYLMHRLADPDDPMIFFYGDGAGAAVLEPSDKPGFVTAAAHADGSYAHQWGIFAGGTAEPASIEAVEAGRTQVRRRSTRWSPDRSAIGSRSGICSWARRRRHRRHDCVRPNLASRRRRLYRCNDPRAHRHGRGSGPIRGS